MVMKGILIFLLRTNDDFSIFRLIYITMESCSGSFFASYALYNFLNQTSTWKKQRPENIQKLLLVINFRLCLLFSSNILQNILKQGVEIINLLFNKEIYLKKLKNIENY